MSSVLSCGYHWRYGATCVYHAMQPAWALVRRYWCGVHSASRYCCMCCMSCLPGSFRASELPCVRRALLRSGPLCWLAGSLIRLAVPSVWLPRFRTLVFSSDCFGLSDVFEDSSGAVWPDTFANPCMHDALARCFSWIRSLSVSSYDYV